MKALPAAREHRTRFGVVRRMKTLARTIATFSFASILAALAAPASAQTTGTLTHDGVAMPVKAAVAVLNAKGTSIRIYVLPFEPTAAETALLQKESTLFLMQKKSAYGSFRLVWFGAADAGRMDKASVSLTGNDISKPNSNLSRMFMSGFKGTLTGELKPGASIGFTAAGSAPESRDTVAWDVKVQTKVLPATE
jgi:hypothetical protein